MPELLFMKRKITTIYIFDKNFITFGIYFYQNNTSYTIIGLKVVPYFISGVALFDGLCLSAVESSAFQ